MIKADHALTQLFAKLDSQTQTAYRDLPAKVELQHFAEELFNFLFPINCRQERRAGSVLMLADQLQRMLAPILCGSDNRYRAVFCSPTRTIRNCYWTMRARMLFIL